MAQRSDMTEKIRILIDGEEVAGLVNVGERPLEKGQIQVPGFDRTRTIQNGISTIPPVEMTYKVRRDSETLAFLREWYAGDEVHDITLIRTDAAGVEFDRELLPGAECVRFAPPAYDAATPTYAQVSITVAPEDIISIGAE